MSRSLLSLWLAFALAGAAARVTGAELKFDFSAVPERATPPGFRSVLVGQGPPGEWQVLLADFPSALKPYGAEAPNTSRRKVLAQLASDPTDERFPGPGAVAAYLWAVDPTDADDADRVLAWVERYQASEEGEDEDEGEDEENREEKPTMTQKPAALPVGMEYRVAKTSALTVRDDGRTFSGYVALFDSPSDGLGFTEVIKPNAFNRTLSRANRGEANIVALYGHDPMEFLGSTAAGNLTLRTDETGLIAELALPSTQRGNDLAALFDAGEAVSMGMSFGFSIPTKNGEKWDEDGTVRELREIRLHEVSLLSGGQTPAYPATIGLGSVRALANRLDVTPEEARDAVDALLSGDVTRTAILVRALGAEKEEEPTADAPVADEPAPVAIIDEGKAPEVVPPSTLAYLASIESRRK
jgi:HK97 family phage prohead protease